MVTMPFLRVQYFRYTINGDCVEYAQTAWYQWLWLILSQTISLSFEKQAQSLFSMQAFLITF